MGKASATGLALALMGCGTLSANSTTSASEVIGNSLLYGAMALASTARAPSDPRAPLPPIATTHPRPTHAYLCFHEDGEPVTFRARSEHSAARACGEDCDCVDAAMREELRLQERRYTAWRNGDF